MRREVSISSTEERSGESGRRLAMAISGRQGARLWHAHVKDPWHRRTLGRLCGYATHVRKRAMMARFTSVEATIDAAAQHVLASLPRTGMVAALVEFVVFGLKQGWACLFGGLMLGLLLAT